MKQQKIENVELHTVANEEHVLHAEVTYPRHSKIHTIEIGLCDVRASDDIRIYYDFERDGWVILQPRETHPHIEGNSYGSVVEWIESAFCPAWKYELPDHEKFK